MDLIWLQLSRIINIEDYKWRYLVSYPIGNILQLLKYYLTIKTLSLYLAYQIPFWLIKLCILNQMNLKPSTGIEFYLPIVQQLSIIKTMNWWEELNIQYKPCLSVLMLVTIWTQCNLCLRFTRQQRNRSCHLR